MSDYSVDPGATIERLIAEREALQVFLTAADERADVLEGLLRLLAELPGVRTSGMWERVVATLKPAGGRGISFEKIAQFNDDDGRPERDD